MIEDILWIPAALIGLIVGSFINVVAYRVPLKRSVVSPGSACPKCDHAIAWSDNIPVLSWVRLRGRCRHCGERISPRYPFVEISTAVLFGITAGVIGAVWVLPAYLWFVGVTIALTITDVDHQLIPNRILFPGTAVGAVLLLIGSLVDGSVSSYGRGLLGALIYFGALLVLALIVPKGFGLGDVKLAALLGLFTAYLGWGSLAIAVVLPFWIGGVISILLLVTRIKGRKDKIPFGPYLVIGAYLAIAYGEQLFDWWLN